MNLALKNTLYNYTYEYTIKCEKNVNNVLLIELMISVYNHSYSNSDCKD